MGKQGLLSLLKIKNVGRAVGHQPKETFKFGLCRSRS